MNTFRYRNWIITFFLILAATGCSSVHSYGRKPLNPQHLYKITLPGKPWEKIKVNGEDIAMLNREDNCMFAVISHLINNDTTTLDILYRVLFTGIKEKRVISRKTVNAGGRTALHIVLEGRLDGTGIKISAYIIKADNLVHDIVYWAVPSKFDSSLDDFEGVVKSFEPVKGNTD